MKEYIYNRYNGIITTYKKIRDKEYLCIETGLTICFDLQLLLGKNSESIIDLIEVGDYVNGEEVIKRTGKVIETYCNEYITDQYIKSIVTKEQFKSVEYKVGG